MHIYLRNVQSNQKLLYQSGLRCVCCSRCVCVCSSQVLQQKLESSFYSGSFVWDEVSPNDAAALMKKLVRELPAPLLTAEHLNAFSAVKGVFIRSARTDTQTSSVASVLAGPAIGVRV